MPPCLPWLCVDCSTLRPPMMTSLLRKLVVDVPALTDNTIVALRVGLYSTCVPSSLFLSYSV